MAGLIDARQARPASLAKVLKTRPPIASMFEHPNIEAPRGLVGAKVGANMHRHLAMPGAIQPRSSQVNGTLSDAERCRATAQRYFGSRGPPVRIRPSRPKVQVTDLARTARRLFKIALPSFDRQLERRLAVLSITDWMATFFAAADHRPRVIAATSSGSSLIDAAATLAWTCSGDPVPGIGRICRDLASNQARTICRGLAPCRVAAAATAGLLSACWMGAQGRNAICSSSQVSMIGSDWRS